MPLEDCRELRLHITELQALDNLLQFLLLFCGQLDEISLHRVSWKSLAASWRPFSINRRQKAEALLPCRVFRRDLGFDIRAFSGVDNSDLIASHKIQSVE